MKVCCAWLYAITKYGYPPSMEKIFASLKEISNLGFESTEIEIMYESQLSQFWRDKEEIRRMCNNFNLNIIDLCAIFPDIVSLNDDLRLKSIKHFEECCEITRYLGCDMIQLDSFSPPINFLGKTPYKEAISFGHEYKVDIPLGFDWSIFWDEIVDTFKTCSELAEKYGLKLCLEPRVGENISNTDSMLRLMDAVGHENFGAVLDTGHLHAQKEILPLSVEKLKSKVFYVHASDNDGRDNFHLPLGKGTIDWESLIKALAKHSYKGYIAIDVGGTGYEGNIEEDIVSSKFFIEGLLDKLNLLG